jgi:hypothetical protein
MVAALESSSHPQWGLDGFVITGRKRLDRYYALYSTNLNLISVGQPARDTSVMAKSHEELIQH